MNGDKKESIDFENIGCILYVLCCIVNPVIHIWTVIIAYKTSGLWAAVISTPLPVVSEIYWLIRIGVNDGFTSPYCVTVIALLPLLIPALLIYGIGIWREKKD